MLVGRPLNWKELKLQLGVVFFKKSIFVSGVYGILPPPPLLATLKQKPLSVFPVIKRAALIPIQFI